MAPRWNRRLMLLPALIFASVLFATVESFAPLLCQENKHSQRQSLWALPAEAERPRSTTPPTDSSHLFIYYSPTFYRHVVCQQHASVTGRTTKTQVLESFEWMDEAMDSYPEATLVPLKVSVPVAGPVVAGGGIHGDALYNVSTDVVADPPCEITWDTEFDGFFHDIVPSSCHSETLKIHDFIIGKLDERLGSSIYARFPEHDRQWVKQRILFLLSPRPPKQEINASSSEVDWPKRFLTDGYGLGFTARQAFLAIQGLRHLLMIHPLEASAKKPPISFFYRDLGVRFDDVEQVRNDWAHWLTGATVTDAATIAFLRSINVTVDQSQTLLEVFAPSLISCDLEPIWEFSGTRKIRASLREDALHCLRMRLRLHPRDICGMLKTAPYVTFCSQEVLESRMNTLQETMCLSSEEMRQLHLRNAAVLGVPSTKIRNTVSFLMNDVNLSKPMMRKAIFKIQRILRYDIEAYFKPKLTFLKQELCIPPSDITDMLERCPSILSTSLERRLRPIMNHFFSCGFTTNDVRQMVVNSPDILTLNLKNNLQPKMQYIQRRMGIDNTDVRVILTKAPRLLLHSVVGNLEPKLQLLEMAAPSTHSVATVIVDNPGLLLANKLQFRRRLEMFLQSGETFEDYFSHKDTIRQEHKRVIAKRKKKPILEIDSNTSKSVRIHASVTDASTNIGTTTINMYSLIRTGRPYNGKIFKYGEMNDDPAIASLYKRVQETAAAKLNLTAIDKNPSGVHGTSRDDPLEDILRECHLKTGIPPCFYGMENKSKIYYLTSFVSGRTYPPKNATYHPATENAGGLAIYLPQFHGGRVKQVVNIITSYLGHQMLSSPLNDDGLLDGMLMVEYKYHRPSRDRCSIFVCFEVLRIIARLLSLEAARANDSFTDSIVLIDIFTDSNYASQTLSNSTALLQWGITRKKDGSFNDQSTPTNNKDILFPLARLYSCLRKQAIFCAFAKQKGVRFAKEIRIRFRHQSELELPINDYLVSTIGDRANKAAEMQYGKMMEMGVNELVWRNRAGQDLFFF